MTLLAAYTGPTPVSGYVGYVNLSLCDDGVQITVRSESLEGNGAACHTIPVENARAMLFAAIAALDEAREAMLDAQDMMSNHAGYPFFTVKHTGDLWPFGVAEFLTLKTDRLTPLGLEVRAILEANNERG